MSAHTPLPWITDGHLYGGQRYYTALDRAGFVCSVPCRNDEGEANARLIASAPDLLAMLETLVDVFEDYDGSCPAIANDAIERAKELIAKAKGESV